MKPSALTTVLALTLSVTLLFTSSSAGCAPTAPAPAPTPEPAATPGCNRGIILTQAQANIVLVSQGYNVVYTDHELLEAEESETEVTVRANHIFDAVYGGSTIQLSGEGVYRWRGTSADNWTEEMSLTLAMPQGTGRCTINYIREYSAKAGSYKIEVTRSTSSTIQDLSSGIVASSLTSTPTSASSNHVEFWQETISRNGMTRLEGSKDETFVSPTKIVGTAKMTLTTNGANPRLCSTRYNRTADITYEDYLLLDTSPLLEINAYYDTYDITIEQRKFSLEEPAYFKMEGSDEGKHTVTWKLKVGDGTETLLDTAGSGNLTETIANGKPAVTANLEELVRGVTYLMYVDSPGLVIILATLVCAVGTAICAGVALDQAAKPDICDACGGTGRMEDYCPSCGGTGKYDCPVCHGASTYSCPSCGGRGKLTCSICGGDGELKCESCLGFGRWKCDFCDELGYPPCPACEEFGPECPLCDGTGWWTCPICKGVGWKLCPGCDGSRYLSCTNCGGQGELDCVSCGGKGKLDCGICLQLRGLCPACGGKGKILREGCPHCGGDGQF